MIVLTVTSQVIALGFQPLLKATYSVEQFGRLELYTRISYFLSIALSLRLEYALYRYNADRGFRFVVLAICALPVLFATTLLVVCGLVATLNSSGSTHIAFDDIVIVAFAIISAGAACLSRIVLVAASLKGRFVELGLGKMARRSLEGFSQLFSGTSYQNTGLFIGEIVGTLSFSIVAGARYFRRYASDFSRRNLGQSAREILARLNSLKKTASEFPKQKLAGDLVDAAAESLIVFIVLAHFGLNELGILELSLKLLVAPTALIAASLSPLIIRVAGSFPLRSNAFCTRILAIFIFFVAAAVSYAVFLVAFSDALIGQFFGPAWAPAVQVTLLILPGIMFQFAIGPFGEILTVAGRIAHDRLWKIIRFFLLSTMFFVPFGSIDFLLMTYSWILIGSYSVYLVLIMSAVIGARK